MLRSLALHRVRAALVFLGLLLASLPLTGHAQAFTTLHSFDAHTGSFINSDGVTPIATLVQASDGNFYGTAEYGGQYGHGTVFQIKPNGTFNTIHSFSGRGPSGLGSDGSRPWAGLIQASDGYLYGTTYEGGLNDIGTIFRLATGIVDTLQTLRSFRLYELDGAVSYGGFAPFGGLIQASDGFLYGMTTYTGGADNNGHGIIYKIRPGTEDTLEPVHIFNGTDGDHPAASLVQASDGNLYGTTTAGGEYGNGNVFILPITTGGPLENLHSFGGQDISDNGVNPECTLIQAGDGMLYGTTTNGGPLSLGTVFKITTGTDRTFTQLASFGDNSLDGFYPYAGLMQASNGKLYGTTTRVSGAGGGTVFQIATEGGVTVCTTIYRFSVLSLDRTNTDGSTPYAGLIQASDGKLYGTATAGGANGSGTIFSLSIGAPLFGITVSPGTVTGGANATGTVALASAAPVDTTVTLQSDNPAATVPASVTVLQGQTQASFNVATTVVSTDTPVTLSASSSGTTKTAQLIVAVKRVATLMGLAPSGVVGGQSSIGTVTVSPAAPAGGTLVTLSSSNSHATVPASVTVLEGQTQASFTINTTAVDVNTTASIKGSAGGLSASKSLSIKRHEVSSLTFSPTSVYGGNPATGTVKLNGAAPPGGKLVTLASDRPEAVVPASVTVLEGKTTATFTVATTAVATQVNANVSATLNVTKTTALPIKPPVALTVTLSPTSVFGGFSSKGTVKLTGPAPIGGTLVTLTSSRAEATTPASITIAAGQVSGTFTVTTVVVYADVPTTISATAGGVTKPANFKVKADTVKSLSLTSYVLTGGASTAARVYLTAAAGPGGAVVTLSSDNAVATLPASVTVPEGQTSAGFTVQTTPVGAQVLATVKAAIGVSYKTKMLTINP